MWSNDDVEIELAGGNDSVVVQMGDTVRRNTRAWSPAVHDLLEHLQASGFDGVPGFLGIDANPGKFSPALKAKSATIRSANQ